jgi:hypothetical protein
VLPPEWRALNLGKRSCPSYTISSRTRCCTPPRPSVKPSPWLLSPKYHDSGSTGQSRDRPTEEVAVAAGPADPVAAATRAASVFLFLLPGGRPRRGAEGEATIAVAVIAFFLLPHGRPSPRFFSTPTPSAFPVLRPPMADMVGLCSGEEKEVELAK